MAFIMAGGSGERFWPLSRVKRPKQLLKLTSPTETLLEEAVNRVAPLVQRENVGIITGRHLLDPIQEAACVNSNMLLAEPNKRNTLGALIWVAANLIARNETDSSLAILTADHKIDDAEAFRETVRKAMETAEETGALVTCGIKPTRPEIGYGYIELDRDSTLQNGAIHSNGFREKPNAETAVQFVESGSFLWNSGMFFFTLPTLLDELARSQPECHAITVAIAGALQSGDNEKAEEEFNKLPNISFDYAIAEKAESIYVVEATFGWDDVGAWDALSRSLSAQDDSNNTSFGDVVLIDNDDCIFYNDHPEIQVASVGCSNLILVLTKDALLACPKDQAQRVKEIVEQLKKDQSERL